MATKRAPEHPQEAQEGAQERFTASEAPESADSGNLEPADDPYKLAALRSATSLGDLATETVTLKLAVARPSRKTGFIRVRPEPEYMTPAALLEYEDDLTREYYWVDPPLWSALEDDLTMVHLFTCVRKKGMVPFLWPAKLPGDNKGGGRQWAVSGLQAVEICKTSWGKVHGNTLVGAYEVVVAKGRLPEPKWPDKSFRELLDLAFGDRFIRSMDHPIVAELEGRE
jgi:hypothetical protein